jgi:RNA polymerase sigma-70 factor (ECF subfamily)
VAANPLSTEPAPAIGPAAKIDWAHALAEHGRWLRTVAIARMGSSVGVDEVLQEVSLAAVKQAAPLQDPTKVAPWLYRLVVTHCLLHRRTLGRRRKLTERYTTACPPSDHDASSVDPLAWLLAEERQRLIRQALEQLPHRDRELLLLKYTEDWNYHQIAHHLGLSHSAVETRLHRARAKLRTRLMELQVIETGA